jgi:hypothetical protein
VGVGLNKGRKKKPSPMDFYNPNKEDLLAHHYCVRNNIRISMVPQQQGMAPETFKVSISIGDNYKKINLSPNTYSAKEIYNAIFEFEKYYYNKYHNK